MMFDSKGAEKIPFSLRSLLFDRRGNIAPNPLRRISRRGPAWRIHGAIDSDSHPSESVS